jgi:hypothetical protein
MCLNLNIHIKLKLISNIKYNHSWQDYRSSSFWVVMQKWLVVTDVSGQSIGPIFSGQEVQLTTNQSSGTFQKFWSHLHHIRWFKSRKACSYSNGNNSLAHHGIKIPLHSDYTDTDMYPKAWIHYSISRVISRSYVLLYPTKMLYVSVTSLMFDSYSSSLFFFHHATLIISGAKSHRALFFCAPATCSHSSRRQPARLDLFTLTSIHCR